MAECKLRTLLAIEDRRDRVHVLVLTERHDILPLGVIREQVVVGHGEEMERA